MKILRFFVFHLYLLVSLPFYVLNALQRHLSKPWRFFFKQNSGNDARNKKFRSIFEYAKIPLYIVLTPLRLINAIYYNIIVHTLFEYYNYLCEVIVPSNEKEGKGNSTKWVLWIPYRIIKYLLFHGLLTLIENVVWTVFDTFVPALTLYHGTNKTASSQITGNPTPNDAPSRNFGVWLVGGGNFSGKGIFFTPERNIASYYANDSIIVARVSLGRVLDLGLAPKEIYNLREQLKDTTAITTWGLNNGYVTGEWWYHSGYWEYCMFDYQNRYNHSWRIRPLYVLDLKNSFVQRIPGGMTHWLFRDLVIKDIINDLK